MISTSVLYREPFSFSRLLKFYRDRALDGVEEVGDDFYRRWVRLGDCVGSFEVRDDPANHQLTVEISDSLKAHAPFILKRVAHMFDTACDPQEMLAGLAQFEDDVALKAQEDLRVPGCFDPFETSCRAILGQQVSVQAANVLASRIVKNYGGVLDVNDDGGHRVFPTPDEMLNLEPLEDYLGKLGVVSSRSRAIRSIAQLLKEPSAFSQVVETYDPDLVEEAYQELLAIKGIGPWTANYILMRAVGHKDAFLENDVGVARALPDLKPKERAQLAQSWRPWRSYAVLNLWSQEAQK